VTEAVVGATAATLPFLVAAEPDGADTLGVFGRSAEIVLRQVPVAALRENIRQLVATLHSVFDEVAGAVGELSLKEAQISFQVTASGSVQLLGVGGEVSGGGGIVFTFGR
jgi:hypothetical protein